MFQQAPMSPIFDVRCVHRLNSIRKSYAHRITHKTKLNQILTLTLIPTLTLTLLTLLAPGQSWVYCNLGPPLRGLPNRHPNLGLPLGGLPAFYLLL